MKKIFFLNFAILFLVFAALRCTAQTETVLHSFTGARDGGESDGTLVLDSHGNLYGTTNEGGTSTCDPPNHCGIVFELHLTSGHWRERVLHNFSDDSIDGGFPFGGLVTDGKGNFYGTTLYGGCSLHFGPCGTVYEVSQMAPGLWKEQTIYSFTAAPDGDLPVGELVLDRGET